MENPFNVEKPVRPTFLTVLCILTFIGSGCTRKAAGISWRGGQEPCKGFSPEAEAVGGRP